VFQNLIKNAFDAFPAEEQTPKPRAISVTGREVSGGMEIDFSDNGRGMSRDELTIVRQFNPCWLST
jgi:nitrogen fixation/metabolism regulation signal transduction histidine kinase